MVRGDSGGMSSPYSGESASPYSDHSAGVPSPPTVVTAYNRPYEAVHHDGPFLQIVDQPQSKFRFRYKSEMVGTHGQLKADRSDKNKAVFPTVKLAKWNNGPAVIRLMLYTAEDNVNQRKRHVHELSGKHCCKETGICEVVVDENIDYTAVFQNLGIIHIAKRDTKDIILQRKRDELISHARLRKPRLSYEDVRRSITPADNKRMEEEAEEEAKNMDLNKVVLRFQAFQYDKKIEGYRPVTLPVDSDIVYNLKNATTGELKIVRMSACSAPCTGGTEIWLLVEKVRRNNIHIKFFELDENDREVWSGYGDFTDGDVHHQYAIVFKTPRYRYTNLSTAVRVKVQLERPTDRDTSEPLDFTFMPDTLKRRRMQIENAQEEGKRHPGFPPAKRPANFNNYASEAIDLSYNMRNPHGQEDTVQTPDILDMLVGEFHNSNGLPQYTLELPSQSPQHTVPSPGNPSDSSNQELLYSPMHPGSTGTPTTEFITINNTLLQVPSPGHPVPNSPQHSIMSPGEQSVGSPQSQYQGSGGFIGNLSQQFSQSQSPQYTQSPSPVMMVPSPSYQENGAQVINQYTPQQQQLQQHQQLQQQQTQELPKMQQMGSQQMILGAGDIWLTQQPNNNPIQQQQLQQQLIQEQDNSNGTQFELPSSFNYGSMLGSDALIDMLEIAEDHLNFSASMLGNSDIKADYGGKLPDAKKKLKNQSVTSGQDVDEITKMISNVRVDDNHSSNNPQSQVESSNQRSNQSVDVAFKVAVSAAECLQAYAATGDISLLLATHRYLLAVQNNQGDTALHTAVSNKNIEAFNKILKACEKISPQDLLNAQNFARETALHQAVRGNEMIMVRRLVAMPGCDVSIADAQGNTPVHTAAQLQSSQCLEALLTRPVNGVRSAVSQAINSYNYDGETPLHLAVINGNLDSVRMLIDAGAQVHHCERKRGANPLHLAVMHGQHEIARYLLENTSVTIEAGLFDGNTALHLAAQQRDGEMCKILLRQNADPNAKNWLQKRKKLLTESEEDEEEEEEAAIRREEEEDADSEEEPDCYTPFDYAGDDEEILALLRGEGIQEEAQEGAQAQEEVVVETKAGPLHSALDSGIDISVTDVQCSDDAPGDEDSVGELSERVRGRLASHLSGDTWRHLAQLLDLDYLVPSLAGQPSPASTLLHPDNMKSVSLEKLRECLGVLGLKECVAVLDQA